VRLLSDLVGATTVGWENVESNTADLTMPRRAGSLSRVSFDGLSLDEKLRRGIRGSGRCVRGAMT
jgi:hypothetical protein